MLNVRDTVVSSEYPGVVYKIVTIIGVDDMAQYMLEDADGNRRGYVGEETLTKVGK